MSNYSSWDRSSNPADTKISMLPTSDISIAAIQNVEQLQASSDSIPNMFPSNTTASNTYQQQQQQQQQQVVHYPEIMQLGKRKFQSDDDQSNDLTVMTQHPIVNDQYGVTLPSTSSSKAAKTKSSSSIDDNEAGLSLLFAASLIQQQGHNNAFSTQTSTHNFFNSNVVVDAATTTTKKRIVSCESVSFDPLSSSHESFGQPIKTTELNRIDSTENKMISSNNDSEFIEPTAHDVLCGRGGGINRHFGNVIYRRVVEYNKKVYKQVPKRHRMLVSRSIVQAILNSGGRFLQEHKVTTTSSTSSSSNSTNDGMATTQLSTISTTTSRWTRIPLRRAVQKTSQALRERSEDQNHHHDVPEGVSMSHNPSVKWDDDDDDGNENNTSTDHDSNVEQD